MLEWRSHFLAEGTLDEDAYDEALRSAGVLPDSWAMQYAVLIGSAIEIPLLLYILHQRAKHFSENRARLRAMDGTDSAAFALHFHDPGNVIPDIFLAFSTVYIYMLAHWRSRCDRIYSTYFICFVRYSGYRLISVANKFCEISFHHELFNSTP